MSLWAKLGLGCGVLLLIVGLACGSCVFWGFRKGAEALDTQWAVITHTTEQLSTVEGSQSLYQANPGLKDTFPTEEDFLKAAAEWRPGVAKLPTQRPDMKSLFKEQKLDMRGETFNGRKVWHLKYHMNTGKSLSVETENGKLTDLRVE